jgi:hypothetical protein
LVSKIVFCKFGNSFNLSFLGVFNAKLIKLIKFVVSEEQENLFASMVYLLFGIEPVFGSSDKIWGYFWLYKGERDKVRDLHLKLRNSIPNIYTPDSLNSWLKLF